MPVLDNDLVECYFQISSFIKKENLNNFNSAEASCSYETVNVFVKNILDIKRYLNI